MVIVVLLLGAILAISGFRGEEDELLSLAKDDFLGADGFILWGLAIFFLTQLQKIKFFGPIAGAFIVLVFVVIFLRNETLPDKFIDELNKGISDE